MDSIVEYLKYYVGRQATLYQPQYCRTINVKVNGRNLNDGLLKPIVRRLSSMNDEEAKELCLFLHPRKTIDDIEVWSVTEEKLHYSDGSKWYGYGVEELNDLYIIFGELSPEQFHYLLSKGFWLWDNSAFDKGLIIDSETLK